VTTRTPPAGNTESKRLDAFVDAAFAFAVTLLLIAGAEPLTSMDGLTRALLQIPASAASFALVALFWMGHRDYGRLAPRRDRLSTLLSLAIVFAVLVYVYPLRMLVSSGLNWATRGLLPGSELIRTLADLRSLFVIYGLGFAALAGLFVLLFTHLARSGDRLGADAAGREEAANDAAIWAISGAGGAASALLAAAGPIRHVPWLPGMAYWLIPLGIWLRLWLVSRAAKPAKPAPRPARRPKAPPKRR
jgi:hypothetical protein